MDNLFDLPGDKIKPAPKTNKARQAFIDYAANLLNKRYPRMSKPERVRRLKRFCEREEIAPFLDALENQAFLNFVPRPDDPANFDQQASFCYNRDSVSFLIGGNAAGTTEAAAYKTALFVLRQQEAPRPDTPFWILSNTYQQTCATCWQEKLLGHGHIPEQEIDWSRVSWISRAKGWPESVPLKPWKKSHKTNWRLEFKSYGQGRQALQARSIGGFWFSEQFPQDVFLEVLRGCREYMFPGGQFAEFTPIDPTLCIWVEKIMESPPPGWAFYRANTRKNRENLADGWFDQFFSSVSDEMLATRMTGALATYEGAIYPSFNPAIHVVDPPSIPFGVQHYRAIDWGASVEHPFVCLWGFIDAEGVWTIYDEYWSVDQTKLLTDHIREIEERSVAWGYPTEHREQNPFYGALYADPSRPDNIAAFSAEGVWIEPAANDVFKGIEAVRVALKVQPPTNKPRLRISNKCVHLIDEMRTYRWRKSNSGRAGLVNPAVAAPAPLKRDDDTVDALRYLIYSYLCRSGVTTPEEATKRTRRDWEGAVWGGR